MVRTDFEAERAYEDDRFSAQTVFRSDRLKVVMAYFDAGQFIPVHAPDSDVVVTVQSGSALVREGEAEHAVDPGEVVVVDAGRDRGVRAVGDRVEALLVTAPPPTEEEHAPVRAGLREDTFDPGERDGATDR